VLILRPFATRTYEASQFAPGGAHAPFLSERRTRKRFAFSQAPAVRT